MLRVFAVACSAIAALVAAGCILEDDVSPLPLHPAEPLPFAQDGVVVLPHNGRLWVSTRASLADSVASVSSWVEGAPVDLDVSPAPFTGDWLNVDVAPLPTEQDVVVHVMQALGGETLGTALRVHRTGDDDVTSPTVGTFVVAQRVDEDIEAEPDALGAAPGVENMHCTWTVRFELDDIDDDHAAIWVDLYDDDDEHLSRSWVQDGSARVKATFTGRDNTLPTDEFCFRVAVTDGAGNAMSTQGCVAPEGLDDCVR